MKQQGIIQQLRVIKHDVQICHYSTVVQHIDDSGSFHVYLTQVTDGKDAKPVPLCGTLIRIRH